MAGILYEAHYCQNYPEEVPDDLAALGITKKDLMWIACRQFGVFNEMPLRERAQALVDYLRHGGQGISLPYQNILEGDASAASWAAQAREELVKRLLARAVACAEMPEEDKMRDTLISMFGASIFGKDTQIGAQFTVENSDKLRILSRDWFALGANVEHWWDAEGRFKASMSKAVDIMREAIKSISDQQSMQPDVLRTILRAVSDTHRML